MTRFDDLLLPATVIASVSASNKKTLINQLASVAAHVHGLDAKQVAATLTDRERIGSTGFGGGIAIPHGKFPGLPKIIGVFARLAAPIDYQAIDELPVDLVFMMLSPPDAGAEHLKALAGVSRRLRDQGFVAKLRGAGSADALYVLWTADETRDAA
ncbi:MULTISPECIES: PTS sugar transporter subunit IIA [Sphingomonas]|uniref:PTS sugar transporter subunit IIA n=1 Tax=Sphingomonas TaxID=13687 RepID=UPI00082EF368|nr:PTS sugar transporter subunit IIA [Sphingomonas sp. CCH10-B3]MBA3879944.1 PTS lactose transporter subunit IIC [Sphingobium sp.]